MRGRKRQTALADFHEFLHVVCNAAAGAAQSKGRANHGRESHTLLHFQSFGHGIGNAGTSRLQTDLFHCFLEALAVFGLIDHVGLGADQLHAVLLQNALAV